MSEETRKSWLKKKVAALLFLSGNQSKIDVSESFTFASTIWKNHFWEERKKKNNNTAVLSNQASGQVKMEARIILKAHLHRKVNHSRKLAMAKPLWTNNNAVWNYASVIHW